MNKAYLILADGTVFEGKPIGATGSTTGETVFTTGMTGYLETLTDPSYYGQIVTQTFPLIGNYGVIPEDFESKKSWVKGYIVRERCPEDDRCVIVSLTEAGDALKEKAQTVPICMAEKSPLTREEAEILYKMLYKLLHNLHGES